MKTLGSRIRNLPRSTSAVAVAAAMTVSSAGAAPRPRAVIIHGIWDTMKSLSRMENAIQAAGFETLTVQLTPNDGSCSLDTLAAQVHHEIETNLGRDEPFSIVAFSMGGLVARSYLRQFGNPARIPAVVTIAAPHRGTWLAWFSILPGVREMQPDSKFLRDLANDHLRFPETKWTTIRSPLDLMIVPSTSSMLPWAENIAVPVAAHPLIAFDRRVIDHTLRALGVSTKLESAAPASRRAGSLPRRIPGTPPLPKASLEAQ